MKISIITVCYNAERFVRTAIESVLSQDYPDIEYIIVDGASKDSTMQIVHDYGNRIHTVISEPDKGLYDAMNKGLRAATGDIIGILNADDLYAHPSVLSHVAAAFVAKPTDSLYGDLVYVNEEDLTKVVRYYKSASFRPTQFRQGKMPPHPTFFARREVYDRFGGFDTQFRICADFDILLRLLLVAGISYQHLPEVMIHMRTGGASTSGFFKSTVRINREMLASCRKNGVNTNLFRIYSKYLTKVFQLVLRPR